MKKKFADVGRSFSPLVINEKDIRNLHAILIADLPPDVDEYPQVKMLNSHIEKSQTVLESAELKELPEAKIKEPREALN